MLHNLTYYVTGGRVFSRSDNFSCHMTISPPDPAIHTVYCVTFPHDKGPAQKMKIEVFLFDESTEVVDWNLY